MDIGLPDINGDELTRQIRNWERHQSKHIPIVGLTAHVDAHHHAQYLEVGMEAVFSKPLTQEKAREILMFYIK